MPALERLKATYAPKGVRFLALSLEPDAALVEAGARKLNLTMQVAIAQGEVLAPLGIGAVPATVFVDKSGTIVAAATGERSPRSLESRVRALLGP